MQRLCAAGCLSPSFVKMDLWRARTGSASATELSERLVPHLKAALTLDEDGSLHYQLLRAYQAAGQAELAKQVMVKYQQIQKANEAAKRELAAQAVIQAP